MTTAIRFSDSRISASPELARFGVILDKITDAYAHAIESGMEQRQAFETTRDCFTRFGFSQLQAANLTRVIIQAVGSRHNERVYSASELQTIINRVVGK